MSSLNCIIGGITCSIDLAEGAEPLVESSTREAGGRAVVRLKCAWNQRYALAAALLGGVVVPTGGGSFTRAGASRYPLSPNLRCLAVEDIKGQKFRVDTSGTATNGWPVCDVATMTATFGLLPYQDGATDPSGNAYGPNDPSGLPFTVTKFKVNNEVFVPPAGAFYIGPFPSTTKCEEASVGVVRCKTEISMTRKFFPTIPLAAIEALEGKVNAAPFTLGNRTWTKGQVLFVTSAVGEPTIDPNGNYTYDLEHCLVANSDYDWNMFEAKDGSWQFLNTAADGSGSGPFAYGDFTTLP